jgi:hypothetical protein
MRSFSEGVLACAKSSDAGAVRAVAIAAMKSRRSIATLPLFCVWSIVHARRKRRCPHAAVFLQQTATIGLLWPASSFAGRFVSAQGAATSDPTARIYLNTRRTISPLDRNLFGSFLEHLGRAIYEGCL